MSVDRIRLLLEKKVSEDPPVYRFASFDRLFVKELLQFYDALKEERDGLYNSLSKTLEQLRATEQRRDEEMCRADCLARDVERLRLMEARVKDGKLTEEEFQAICHDLSPDDEERFMRGCHALWQRLSRRVEGRQVARLLGIKPEDVLGG